MARKRLLQWLLVPLAVMLVGELAAQRILASRTEWYEQAHPERVGVMFVGSSRVRAAFNGSAFDRTYEGIDGRDPHAWNVGAGNSTIAAHYLAVRNFLRQRKTGDALTVFVELNQGIPATTFAGTWDDSWVFSDAAYILPRHLRTEDIGKFLRSGTSASQKATITARFALNASALVRYRDGWQSSFGDQGAIVMRRLLEEAGAKPLPKTAQTNRGVRDDPLVQARLAEQKRKAASQTLQVGVDDWDNQILADFVGMVKAAGGKVVFVDLPLSDSLKSRFRGERYEKDRDGFARAMQRWGTAHLVPAIETDDSDFPDLDHITREGGIAFSEVLARDFAALP